MPRNYKIFTETITPAEPPEGIFDRIILAIKNEKELRRSKRLLFSFLSLLIVSLGAIPFSSVFLMGEWRASGISYFLSTLATVATNNFGIFFNLWQDFLISILEAVPVMGVAVFIMNIALVLFTMRLFLYKKGLLLKYLKHA